MAAMGGMKEIGAGGDRGEWSAAKWSGVRTLTRCNRLTSGGGTAASGGSEGLVASRGRPLRVQVGALATSGPEQQESRQAGSLHSR